MHLSLTVMDSRPPERQQNDQPTHWAHALAWCEYSKGVLNTVFQYEPGSDYCGGLITPQDAT